MTKKIWICITILGIIQYATAQNGEIRGKIIEKSTDEPLTGATVVIESLMAGTTADLDGYYILKVAPGNYTVKISFISFSTVELTGVSVEAGRTTEANVVMEELTTGLDEVTVIAMRRMNSEVSLISNIRTSNMVISGISAQQITRTQDRDVRDRCLHRTRMGTV